MAHDDAHMRILVRHRSDRRRSRGRRSAGSGARQWESGRSQIDRRFGAVASRLISRGASAQIYQFWASCAPRQAIGRHFVLSGGLSSRLSEGRSGCRSSIDVGGSPASVNVDRTRSNSDLVAFRARLRRRGRPARAIPSKLTRVIAPASPAFSRCVSNTRTAPEDRCTGRRTVPPARTIPRRCPPCHPPAAVPWPLHRGDRSAAS
jgi:hypothetical protein